MYDSLEATERFGIAIGLVILVAVIILTLVIFHLSDERKNRAERERISQGLAELRRREYAALKREEERRRNQPMALFDSEDWGD